MKKIISLLLSVVLIGTTLFGCTQNGGQNTNDGGIGGEKKKPLKIVATVFPLYDFAHAVAGDAAEVKMLLKPGAEIHSYEPSPADIIEIQKADVFLYVGGESDAWVESILGSMKDGPKQVIRLMDSVKAVEEEAKEGMEAHEHEEHEEHEKHDAPEYDEHIWTSPKNVILMTKAITEALCQTDASNASAFQKNAADYTGKIQKIDDDIKNIVSMAKHKMMVFGDRFPFRYFADEYGLDYRAAFNGCSAETEASAATIAYLIDTIKENHLKAVYYIEMSNQNIAKSVGEQAGCELLLLHSCQNISKDDFESGATYVSIMEQNAKNLEKGLS